MEEVQENQPQRPAKRTIAIAVLCIVAVAFVGCGLYFGVMRKNAAAPPAVLQQSAADFTVLYFRTSPPLGFTVQESSIQYSDGVLIIPVRSSDGRTVTITQQAMPERFSKSNDVSGDEKISGVYGKAAMSHIEGRTTATLISKDGKTLVLVNDTAGVGTNAVKELLRGLQPL